VNILQRFEVPFDGDPLALYGALRRRNPSPFGGMLSFLLVEELMTTETYSHVVHIVSEVAGELAERHDAIDLLAGMFPGGTITGCPKVRCMEIIEELEPVRRGLYTGSFGY
jgi:anthranilate/para-aminobenzoate synthase component I